MKFKNTKEYPNAVTCTAAEAIALKAKGWTVIMHTPGFTSFIGHANGDISMQFSGWMHNLSYEIEGAGEDTDSFTTSFKIRSQKDLDLFCTMIDNFIQLTHNK